MATSGCLGVCKHSVREGIASSNHSLVIATRCADYSDNAIASLFSTRALSQKLNMPSFIQVPDQLLFNNVACR